MNNAGEHQGKLLVSITNGKKLGEVKNLYFDNELTKVTAVLAGSEGGLFSRKELVITRPDIQVNGVGARLIRGADTVVQLENIADADSFVTLSDLRGREIQTEGGTKICKVGDVLYAANSLCERAAVRAQSYCAQRNRGCGEQGSPYVDGLGRC